MRKELYWGLLEGNREHSGNWEVLTLLQQHNSCEAVVKVPEVHAAHAALVVELPVDIERLVGSDLHGPHPLAWHGTLAGALAQAASGAADAALVEGRVELVGPRRAVRVAIAIVVAEEVLAVGLAAALGGEGLVDGGEEVLGQVGGEGEERVEVGCRVLGVEAAEEVPGERRA